MRVYKVSEIVQPKHLMEMAWLEHHTMETSTGQELADGQNIALLRIHDLQEQTWEHMIQNPNTAPSIHDVTPENRHLMFQPHDQQGTDKYLENYVINMRKFIILNDSLNEEIRDYISNKYNISSSKLKNNTGWGEIGHYLAGDLINKEIAEKGISTSRKNNHASNIYKSQHFDMVKDLLASIHDQISTNSSNFTYPKHIISFSYTAFEIQSKSELVLLKELSKSLSDRTIFEHFMKVITEPSDPVFAVFNHVDKLCGIKKYGNFKSLERVLATGRREDDTPAI